MTQAAVEGVFEVPYQWVVGEGNRLFFEGLKEKRILGTRCPECRRILVPAVTVCERCSRECREQKLLPDEGTLTTFVVVHGGVIDPPRPLPYALVLVRLEGAATDLLHLWAAPLDGLAPGMKVRAVWNEDRSGGLFDLAGFAPAP